MKTKYTLIMLLACLSCLSAKAFSEAWYKYPVYVDTIQAVVETPNKVYYQSGPNLFSFSPQDNESYYYSNINVLSENAVDKIYYNADGGYLLVVYEDCNMDMLYDDGTLVNLPEIRDAQLSDTKAINSVAFGAGRIAIATSFGIVIYDEERQEVKESGIFNMNIEDISIIGDNLIIYYRISSEVGRGFAWAPLNQRHNSLDKFTFMQKGYVQDLKHIGNNIIFYTNKSTGELTTATYNEASNAIDNKVPLGYFNAAGLKQGKGYYYTYTDDKFLKIDENGKIETLDLPQQLCGNHITAYNNDNKLWAADNSGLACYDLGGDKPTVLYDKMLYADALTCPQIGYMVWSNDGERLYVSNVHASVYKHYAYGEAKDIYQTTNILTPDHVIDASLWNASAEHSISVKYQTKHGNTRMYGDANWIVEDPDDPNIYYCGNNLEGVYVLKYDDSTGKYQEIGKFNTENSPVKDHWGARVQCVNIDPQGNLWIAYTNDSRVSILPAAKRRQDPATITTSDWKEHTKMANYDIDQKEMQILFCKKSNMVFIISGKDLVGLVAIDTQGTYDDPSDDVVRHWTQFVDQDGITFQAPRRSCFLLEDNRGCVWVGTTYGVFEITKPSNATNDQMTVRRIKVPRNDGTNYADYLLESDQINWMALDPADRKWIATDNSGLFLVSETGDEILKNYTKDNSPLPSNQICSVECDPRNNTVYVGTSNGLYSFLSDATPPQEDFSGIYAYPNPVRVEYSGDVTITGLRSDSLVKIADSNGQVVYQTKSEGGMATWPVCNFSGQRVRSGVYYVFATSIANDTTSGAVTKILVVN